MELNHYQISHHLIEWRGRLEGLDGLLLLLFLMFLCFSPERRRLKGELIEVYKIMRHTDQRDSQYLFPKVGESKTGGHRF